jgi:hypothetical protein
MKNENRRSFLFSMLVCAISATVVVVGTAYADELLGMLTKVDVDAKKITVIEKDTDKEVIVTITDKTESVSKKKGEVVTAPVDLEKVDGYLKKVQENGKKGIEIKVFHEKGVASKIELAKGKRKKAAE